MTTANHTSVLVDFNDRERTITVYALDDNGDDLIDVRTYSWGVDGDDYATKSDAKLAAVAYAQYSARELGCDWGDNDYPN